MSPQKFNASTLLQALIEAGTAVELIKTEIETHRSLAPNQSQFAESSDYVAKVREHAQRAGELAEIETEAGYRLAMIKEEVFLLGYSLLLSVENPDSVIDQCSPIVTGTTNHDVASIQQEIKQTLKNLEAIMNGILTERPSQAVKREKPIKPAPFPGGSRH